MRIRQQIARSLRTEAQALIERMHRERLPLLQHVHELLVELSHRCVARRRCELERNHETLVVVQTAVQGIAEQPCSGCAISGWGWRNGGYWLTTDTVTFATTGTQTIRIQTREDGVRLDQVVISPSRYLSTAPGAAKDDQTIVRPDGG